MKKNRNLGIFAFNTLFENDTEVLSSEMLQVLECPSFLKGFLAWEHEPGFTWSKATVLSSSRFFCVHGILAGDGFFNPGDFVRNVIAWGQQEYAIKRVFIFTKSQIFELIPIFGFNLERLPVLAHGTPSYEAAVRIMSRS